MNTRIVLCGLLLSGLMLMSVAGCASKVTSENYDRIENGMTVAQVQKILGKGQLVTSASGAIGNLGGSTKVYKWVDGEKTITITFINDKVTTRLASGL